MNPGETSPSADLPVAQPMELVPTAESAESAGSQPACDRSSACLGHQLRSLPRNVKIGALVGLGLLVLIVTGLVLVFVRSSSASKQLVENKPASTQSSTEPAADPPEDPKESDPELEGIQQQDKNRPPTDPEPLPSPPVKEVPKPDPSGSTRTRLRKTPELVLAIDMDPVTMKGDTVAEKGAPVDAALSPDGRYLAVGGKFKVIRFFDAHTGKFLCRRPDPRPPMGAQRTMVWVDNRYVVASGSEHAAFAWDSQDDFRCAKAFRMSLYESIQLAWNPKRRLIAMAQTAGIVNVWHFDAPAQPGKGVMGFGDRTVPTEWAHAIYVPQGGDHSMAVQGISWSPDGMKLAAVSKLGLDILDTSGNGPPLSANNIHAKFFAHASVTSNTVRDMPSLKRIPVPASDAKIEPHAYRVDWASDNKLVAVGYGQRKDDAHKGALASTPARIRLFDPASWKQVREWAGHTNRVYALEFSPDASVLASGGNREVFLWDPNTGAKLMTVPAHGDEVSSARWSADGKLLVTCAGNERHDSPTARNNRGGNFAFIGKDRKVRIWRVAD